MLYYALRMRSTSIKKIMLVLYKYSSYFLSLILSNYNCKIFFTAGNQFYSVHWNVIDEIKVKKTELEKCRS